MKEEEDHQRSSAPAKMEQKTNRQLLPAVDWKKVIENFHHRREKKTQHQRAREKKETRVKENRNNIRTVISILPAGWPPISMSKKTTGLDIMYRKFFAYVCCKK